MQYTVNFILFALQLNFVCSDPCWVHHLNINRSNSVRLSGYRISDKIKYLLVFQLKKKNKIDVIEIQIVYYSEFHREKDNVMHDSNVMY